MSSGYEYDPYLSSLVHLSTTHPSSINPDPPIQANMSDRPTHIDLPPPPSAPPASTPSSTEPTEVNPPEASSTRPPPARGILKNSFRRPSQIGNGPIEPATDAERVQWDEANIAATEVGKDSLM